MIIINRKKLCSQNAILSSPKMKSTLLIRGKGNGISSTHGRAEDIAELDWEEIKQLLPELNLPKEVRRLWEDYFNHVTK